MNGSLSPRYYVKANQPFGGQDFSNMAADSDLGLTTINTTDFNLSQINTTDYEIYDYETDIGIPPAELVSVSIVYGLTLLLGVVGNFLVIFAISKYRRMQNVTNTFLTSLASADLLLVLLCVPIKFAKWFSFTWVFGEVLCKVVHYLQNVSVICSVLTLTTMSMERYNAILHPMRSKYMCTVQRARRVCLAVWLSAFILAAPIIVGQAHQQVGVRKIGYWCIKQWPSQIYAQIYELGMLVLILIIPLAIMSFAYASICRELWIVTHRRATMRAENQTDDRYRLKSCLTNNQVGDRSPVVARKRTKIVVDDDATRKSVIKMLVAVIVLFAICWAPTLIDNVLVAFEVLPQLHYGHLKYMRQAFVLMSYINSCINPIVYAFMSKNFRDSFKYALRVCVHSKQYVQKYRYTRQASFQTRSTSEGAFTRTSVNKDYDNELNSARSLASSPFVSEPEDKKIVDGDALL